VTVGALETRSAGDWPRSSAIGKVRYASGATDEGEKKERAGKARLDVRHQTPVSHVPFP